MPTIKSVEVIPDDGGGFRITKSFGGTAQFTKGILSISGTTVQAETTINSLLATQFANDSFDVFVHVFTVTPLSVTVLCINKGLSIPSNWWL